MWIALFYAIEKNLINFTQGREMMKKLCALLIIPFMLTLNCPLIASEISQAVDSSAAGVTTEITYSPEDQAIAGQRIPIELEAEDDNGIDVVRIYFRAMATQTYYYVTLNGSDETYTGLLPAPANGVEGIDYLILVKNNNDQIVKSQNYHMTVVDSDDASAADILANNEKIEVFTEALEAPSSLEGFMDNIGINLANSAVKYGVTSGIYSALEAGTSTSTATASGTVTASSGMSTTAIVASSVGVAAAVGGGVAYGVSASDDDDSSSARSSGSPTGSESVTHQVLPKMASNGTDWLCDIQINVTNTTPGNVVNASATWGKSGSGTADSNGNTTFIVPTIPHGCLSGTITVSIGGSVIKTISDSCF